MPVLPFRQHSHRVELINQDALALVISQLQEEINCCEWKSKCYQYIGLLGIG
jgi:hypothetical protein|tara:strand:+ start:273 stop:428 length:156 start_codon:yes stop_codon:yes gene_type:complete